MLDIRTSPNGILVQGSREEKNYSGRANSDSSRKEAQNGGQLPRTGNIKVAGFQLIIGIVCMVMIANLQYGWNLFVNPINQPHHWGRAAIQVAFSIFVLAETWLVPVESWFVDRFGPRIVVMIGGILVALAWVDRIPWPARFPCFMSRPRFPASARARSMAPAWAMR